MISSDAGKSWNQRPLPEPASDQLTEESLRSIAIDPDDPSAIVASGQEALWESTDQGRHWNSLSPDPGLLTWAEADEIFLVTDGGEVKTSGDRGRTWEAVGSIGGAPAAFEAAGDSLYTALHDGTVKQSSDGGVTWSVRSAP